MTRTLLTLAVVSTGLMAGLFAAFMVWHFLSHLNSFIVRGLLPIGAVPWVLVIVGAMMPDGPVSWLMHRRLLQWLGRISYGIYIYHFPILALVRYYIGRGAVVSTVLVIALTLISSEISYRYLEMPIRRRTFRGRPLATAALAVLAVIAVTTATS